MEIQRIKPPKYRVGRYILNEYELRQLQVDIKKSGIGNVKVKCLTNNTIHTINELGKFDITPKPFSLTYNLVMELL